MFLKNDLKPKKAIQYTVLVFVIFFLVPLGLQQLRKTSPLFNMLFAPSDWSVPLAVAGIDFNLQGKTTILNFENKYPGSYWFEVRVTNPIPETERYQSDFELLLEIKREGKMIASEVIQGPGSSFADIEKGFAIFRYSSPNDLPLREPLEGSVTVIRADPKFASAYGEATLAIRKLADL